VVIYINYDSIKFNHQYMPFEQAAKKAGLSLVRAFLHSIEGVRPYFMAYSVVSAK
jgi:hypothetical protein